MKYEEFIGKVRKRARLETSDEAVNAAKAHPLPANFAHLFEVENEGEIPELGMIADVEEEK